jgi:RimJ/RimL family protein N-acetyltransferase
LCRPTGALVRGRDNESPPPAKSSGPDMSVADGVPYGSTVPSLVTPAVPPGTMTALTQPEITANEITLRPWQSSDRGTVVAAYADPAIQLWHFRSMTDEEAGDWISSWPGRWRHETGAGWAVLDAGDVAGQISLRRVVLTEGVAEVSYWVLPSARGRRVAPRALNALTAWCFGTLGLHRIELNHSTVNAASCRVAQQSGFAIEGTKRSQCRHADGWHDMHLHARISSDA